MPAVGQRSAKVVAIYLALGAAWIFLSDEAVLAMREGDADMITRYQTVKGLLFLAVTGSLLYWLVLRGMTALQRRLEHLHSHDPLTDLVLLHVFRDRVRQDMIHAKRSGRCLAVAALNIDRFQLVVNQVGYQAADRFLRLVARRLESLVRPGDSVARIGGDEFAIAFADVRRKSDVDHLMVKLVDGLKDAFPFEGTALTVSTSFGVALYPDDGQDCEALLRHAATALRRAKADDAGGVEYYTTQMGEAAHEWARIEHALAGALERGEFRLNYQPQVDAAARKLLGAEALLRWNSPSLGAVPPGRFIPIAEASQLIVPIGQWVLAEACRQAGLWRRTGLPDFVMSVNVSARQLRDPGFVAAVQAALEQATLPAGCLEVEVTESMLMEDAQEMLGKIKALKALGVRIAIDDFGTGYSNLAYLRRFRADRLKIDQSFVRTMPDDQEATAIVKTVIALGQTLGLRTIAEGVEEDAQANALSKLGCDELQGYLLGRPMEPAVFESLFRQAREEPTAPRVAVASAA